MRRKRKYVVDFQENVIAVGKLPIFYHYRKKKMDTGEHSSCSITHRHTFFYVSSTESYIWWLTGLSFSIYGDKIELKNRKRESATHCVWHVRVHV